MAQPTGWHTPTTGHVPLLRGPSGWALTKTAEKTTPLPLDAFGSLTHTPLAAADGYGPFGEPDTPTTATVTLGYRGELTTGGLTHLRARDLHPHLGSFTTTDPLDGVPGTPTIANPYHYTDNNPLNRTDPTGLRPDDGDLDLGVVEAQLFGLRGILACDAVLRDAPKGRAITRLTPTSGGRCSYSAIDCVDRSWDVTGLARFGCQHADALLGILQFAASSAAGVICGSAVSVTVVGAGAAAGACAGATARFTGALRNGASLTDALRSALDATGMARDAALGGLTAGALKAAIGAIKALKPGQTIHNLAQKLTRPAPSAARASAAAVEQARFAPGKWLTHFEKHGASNCWGGNCLGYANSVEYLRRAQSLTRGGPGVDTFVRKSGDTLFYRATTNEFGVLTKDNVLRTYFKPDDGLDYWFSQIGGG